MTELQAFALMALLAIVFAIIAIERHFKLKAEKERNEILQTRVNNNDKLLKNRAEQIKNLQARKCPEPESNFTHSRKVVAVNINTGAEYTFESIRKTAKTLHISRKSIKTSADYYHSTGKRKIVKHKYWFKYAN